MSTAKKLSKSGLTLAATNSFSTALTNNYNMVTNNANLTKGVGGPFAGGAVIAETDSVGSTYRLGRVKSNARVSFGVLIADAIGTAVTVNIGLYQPTVPGSDILGAVVDATFFAAGLDVSATPFQTCFVNAGGTMVTSKMEMPIWVVLGVDDDPQQYYDVVVSIATTSNDGAGNIELEMWPIDYQ